MRKKKSLLNIISSIGSYFLTSVFALVTQACVVKILGIEYSGINGLFTNIITMLSIAELGLGETIIFKLYEPIENNDKNKIKSWLRFYKKCYKYIVIVIIIIGLLIIPLIPIIIKTSNVPENIIFLYLIALADSIFSYVLTYKRSLLYADQKNYIITNVHMGYLIFMNLTQIFVLVLWKSFILFLLIKVIYRLIENIIINIYIDKKYPYVNEKAEMISKKEQNDIFERIKAIFLQKISFVVNKGIDNIVISVMLGIGTVGYYTNYNMVAIAASGIIYQIISSFSASVGSLLTEKNPDKNYFIYKKINLINSFFTGLIMTEFICCIKPVIILWVGQKYIMSSYIAIAFVVYIYSDSIRRAITIYKESAGICKEDKNSYIVMAIINLTTSIILCKVIGVSGVIFGTAISYLYLIIFSYPKYIFEPIFKKQKKDYFIENGKYLINIIVSIIISYFIINHFVVESTLLQLLINGIIAVIIFIINFIICFKSNEEFMYYKDLIKREVKNDKRQN